MKTSALLTPLFSLVFTLFLAGCASAPMATTVSLQLDGSQEVPPQTTMAKGSGQVMVGNDRSVSGSIDFSGMTSTMAHIHLAAAGSNGPVIVTLTKIGDTRYVVPDGAMLSEAQMESFRAGNLYVNIHSKEHPAGEIRGQLKAPMMSGKY
jgi:hypothetical protein